jgi:hypothetical protein
MPEMYTRDQMNQDVFRQRIWQTQKIHLILGIPDTSLCVSKPSPTLSRALPVNSSECPIFAFDLSLPFREVRDRAALVKRERLVCWVTSSYNRTIVSKFRSILREDRVAALKFRVTRR